MNEDEPTEEVGSDDERPSAPDDAPEVEDDDVLDVEEDREELDAAMRDLFAAEVRRVATESFRKTRLRDQARERELRERATELRLRIAAETEARLQLATERDLEHDALRARIDELVACLAGEETRREHAEKRARTMEDVARVAESMLAKSSAGAFERGLRQVRQTMRWGTAALALVALLVGFAVLQNENAAEALFQRATAALPVPSESLSEVEAVTGAARPWITSAPAEKPSIALVAPTLDARPGAKPRLARARVRAVVAPQSPRRSPPAPSVEHDDDPLGGLGDIRATDDR